MTTNSPPTYNFSGLKFNPSFFSSSNSTIDSFYVTKTTAETISGFKTFTTSPVAPTPAVNDNSTTVATTEYIQNQGYLTVTTATNSFVDLSSTQTVAGAKTMTGLLTANNGLTVSGTVTLPSSSITQTMVSNGYIDTSSAQTVGGAKSFSSLLTASNGLTVAGTLTLPSSSITQTMVSNGYCDTSSAQTIAGTKTFTSIITGNAGVSSTTGMFSGLLTASNGFTVSSGTLTLPSSSITQTMVSNGYCDTSSTQTIAGAKTFSGITSFSNTTDTTSASTGAIVCSGGIACKSITSTVDVTIGSKRSINQQGLWLQWNRDGGTGKSYIINQKGGGSGGISFGEATVADAYTEGMSLSSGNLTITGSYSGTLASAVTCTTQTAGDNSTKVASTNYVDRAVSTGIGSTSTFSGTLASSVIATTQTAGDNSTKVATTNYVDRAISNNGVWTKTGSDIYYSTGKVGIGTSSPAYTLDVDHGSVTTAGTRFSSSGTDCAISLTNTATSGREYWLGSLGGTGTGAGNFYIYDATGTSTRFVINSSGNIGIGTKTPGFKLDCVGTAKVHSTLTVIGVATFTAVPECSTNCSTNSQLANKLYVDSQVATKVSSQWTTTGSDIYYSTGKVGIGLTSGLDYKLNVGATGGANTSAIGVSAIKHYNDNFYDGDYINVVYKHGTVADKYQNFIQSIYSASATDFKFFTSGTTGSLNATILTLKGSNNYAGILTTSPAYPLDVNGIISTNSKVTCASNTSLNAPSLGVNGGTGDRLILFTGSSTVYPYSIGIETSAIWQNVPDASSYYKWYIGGKEHARLSYLNANTTTFTLYNTQGSTGSSYQTFSNGTGSWTWLTDNITFNGNWSQISALKNTGTLLGLGNTIGGLDVWSCSGTGAGSSTSLTKTLSLDKDGNLTLSGYGYATTPASTSNDTTVATTAFVKTAITNAVGTSASPQFTKLGIGTAPSCALDVNSTNTYSQSAISGSYFNKGMSTLGYAGTSAYSVLARFTGGSVAITDTAYFVAYSDKRTKTILDSYDAISLINQLNVVQYKYKTQDRKQFGFIAQEVKEILPDAITYDANYIPDVFKLIEKIDGKLLTLENHTICENDKIKLYDEEDKPILATVVKVHSPDTFEIDTDLQKDKLFLYGRFVNDLHMLDYNSLFALSFDGVKQVIKKNNELESKVDKLTAFIQSKFPEFNL